MKRLSDCIFGNENLSKFDVLIIGSGCGGSSMASVLAQNGQKVLVLEAGPNYFIGLDNPDSQKLSTHFSNDELKLMRRGFINPDPVTMPRSFRANNSDDEHSLTGDVCNLPATVGGAAAHADLKTPRFFPRDFKMGTLLRDRISGADFQDWPIDYDVLEPFYLHCENELGIQGLEGSIPDSGHRSGPYPMAPGMPMYLGLKASDAAKKLGYHPFPYPMAVNSRSYRGRAACNDCGFCSGYGCSIHAKGTPVVTMLRKALLTGNCQLVSETRAIKLSYSSVKREITGVQAVGPSGEPLLFQADRYVLAASPIEDAKILFYSDPLGKGLGNSSGFVGRNLMFHLHNIVVGVFEERLHPHRGRTVTHGMADFCGIPGNPEHPMGGIVEFATPQHPIEEALEYTNQLQARGALLRSLVRESPLRDRMMVLIMQAQDAPQFANRVDLDPSLKDLNGTPAARISYSNHQFELSAREFYIPKMLDLLGAAGAKFGIVSPVETPPQTLHVMGTLRFGKNSKTSVCDSTGRFHDIGNLYAAGSSLFPTSSGLNPALTMAALSTWAAANMVFPLSPERALSGK